MIDTKTALIAIALPALLTMLSLVIAYAGRVSRPRLAALPGIAMALAFSVAVPLLAQDAKLFVPQGWTWLFWIAIGMAVVAAIELFTSSPAILSSLGTLFTIGAIALLGCGRMAQRNGWTGQTAIEWMSVSVAAILVTWVSAVATQRDRDARVAGIILGATAMVAAAVVGLLGKSQVLSMIAIVPGVCAAMLGLFTLMFPGFRISPITWLTIALLSAATTSAALEPWYAYLPLTDGLLVLAAPIAMWASLLARRDRGLAGPAVALLAAFVFLAVPIEHLIQTIISYRHDGFM